MEHCPVCHDPSLIPLDELPPEVREEIFDPSAEAEVNVYFPQNFAGKSARQLEIEKYIEENEKKNINGTEE